MNIFQNIVEKFRHVEALKKVVRFPVKNSMIYLRTSYEKNDNCLRSPDSRLISK